MKIDRLLAIIFILQNREKVTAAEMADYFDVSVRTIYRDIESLGLTGIPVYAEQGKGGGISLMSNFRLEKRFFLSTELNDLIAAVQEIPEITGDLNLEKAVEKMRLLSGTGIDEKQEDPVISCNFSDSLHPKDKKIMNELSGMIRSEHRVSFSYKPPEKEASIRTVEPLRLIFLNRNWYLQAWCLKRDDYRLFRISRIHDLKLTNNSFDRSVRMKDLPSPTANYSPPAAELDLLFLKKDIQSLKEYFHESDFQETENGIRIKIRWPVDEWVYRFLMGFGPDLVIISPEEVRDEIAMRHRKASDNYFSKYNIT